VAVAVLASVRQLAVIVSRHAAYPVANGHFAELAYRRFSKCGQISDHLRPNL